jgi:hypothetical protein
VNRLDEIRDKLKIRSEVPRWQALDVAYELLAMVDEAEKECVWTKCVMGNYGEYDNWSTSCGEDFAIEEEWHETPTEYCSNCGHKTRESEIALENDDAST